MEVHRMAPLGREEGTEVDMTVAAAADRRCYYHHLVGCTALDSTGAAVEVDSYDQHHHFWQLTASMPPMLPQSEDHNMVARLLGVEGTNTDYTRRDFDFDTLLLLLDW